jgi:hypothetical protein
MKIAPATTVELSIPADDLFEIEDIVPEEALEIDQNRQQGTGRLNEPGTIAIVIALSTLAPPVIQAISAWLIEKRKKNKHFVKLTRTMADGSKLEYEAKDESSEQTPSPEILKQLKPEEKEFLTKLLEQAKAQNEG